MTTKRTFRIAGEQLGENDVFIDTRVDKVTLEGNVILSEKDGERTWNLQLETMDAIREDNMAVRHTNLLTTDHPIWNRLQNVNEDLQTEPFVDLDTDLQEATTTLFTRLVTLLRSEDV